MLIRRFFLPLTAVALLITGCAKPLPPEKLNYAGDWHATGMDLTITKEGRVSYKRLKGGGNVSVDGPIKEFKGNDFSVGIGPLTTTFAVSQTPHEVDGKWKMTVDGVELTRVE